MNYNPLNMAELRQQNEQLREAVEKLVYELEAQRRMNNLDVPTDDAREVLPDPKRKRSPIQPPWEREDFDTKDE